MSEYVYSVKCQIKEWSSAEWEDYVLPHGTYEEGLIKLSDMRRVDKLDPDEQRNSTLVRRQVEDWEIVEGVDECEWGVQYEVKIEGEWVTKTTYLKSCKQAVEGFAYGKYDEEAYPDEYRNTQLVRRSVSDWEAIDVDENVL